MVDYYRNLRNISPPGFSAAVLASSAVTDAASSVVATYKRHNDLFLVQKAFPQDGAA